MDPAYYVAAGSLKARSFQLETVANNLANASTVGYKTEKSFFSVFNKAKSQGRDLLLSGVVNDGTVLAHRGVDFSQGALKLTERKLDLAIEGNAFFQVRTPQGVRPTRDGRFQLGPQGEVQAMDGSPLLGKNGQPVRINGATSDLTVLADGTLQQGGESVGQIDLKAYANPLALQRLGANRYDPTGVAEAPVQARISQGYVEESTVDIPTAMIDMIRLNRLFEMSMKVASTISNDMDARAINDIAVGR